MRLTTWGAKLGVLTEFLGAQIRATQFLGGIILYGFGFSVLGFLYDVEILKTASHYCYGGVFGIALGNHIRYKLAMRLYKEYDADNE